MRTSEAVAEYLAAGAARCILGTKAVEDRRFLEELAGAHPGRISLGLDAKDGRMATKGWIEIRDIKAVDLVRGLAGLPLGEVIYTDIERDGMLEGPNWARLEEMRAASPFPLIASGGVTTVEDLRRLRRLGCFGAIVGKALYDGRLEISQALAEQEESQGPAE
jgi:phosphoribosylformimino-5-aminoimidazole carboxamide ribotide isomerase